MNRSRMMRLTTCFVRALPSCVALSLILFNRASMVLMSMGMSPFSPITDDDVRYAYCAADSAPPSLSLDHTRAVLRIAAQSPDLLQVELNAESRAARQLQREVLVAQRLGENFFREKQRPEQLGAPLQFAERTEQLCGSDRADRTLQHRAAIQIDAGSKRNGRHARRARQAARLRDLHGEHIGCVRAGDIECIDGT